MAAGLSTVALVPAKSLAAAKSRLAPAADWQERAAVALDMLSAVLMQLRQMTGLRAYGVVTSDEQAAAVAQQYGATVIAEEGQGLNRALQLGRGWAIGQGADQLLVVLSDLPLVRATDLDAVLEAASQAAVVIAPSNDGGTNALLLRPPDVIPFRFGRDSARYHRFESEQRGLQVALVQRASLAFDVDGPADLAVYREAQAGAQPLARR